MADLVTRLLLNSSQFDNNITKSTRQIRLMQQQTATMKQGFSSAVGVLTKFGGAVGVAMSASEAFNKIMEHSQTLTDGIDIRMKQATAHVDSFFASLASGNFGSFLNGWKNISDAAEAYSKALDNAGSTEAVITPEIELHNTKYRALLANAQDISLKESDRLEYLRQANEELGKSISLQQTLLGIQNHADYTELNSKFANESGKNATKGFFDQALKVEGNGNAHYVNWINTYEKKLDSLKHKIQTFNGSAEEYTKLKESYFKAQSNSTYNYYKALDAVENNNKELFTKYKMGIVKAEQLEQTVAEANKIMSRTEKRILGGEGSSNGNKIVFKEGSIGEIKAQIVDLNKQLEQATTDSSRQAIQGKINELNEVLRQINFITNHPNAPKVNTTSNLLKQSADPTKGLKVQGFGQIKQKDISIAYDYVDSLNAVANAMGAINTANAKGAASWISWAGSMMTATAIAIDSIRKIVAAKTAEAAASGAAEAAKTPVVGWLMVGGAVASVLAAMASIPKFENGGIVGGNSYSNDRLLARLNSGEMVLNRKQQSNLYSIISGNVQNQPYKVEFRVKAQELVGVLNNYNSKMGRLR